MDNPRDFATTLRTFMARAVRSNRDLAQLTGIAIRTIENWTGGEVRHARFATDVLKVARALMLNEQDATALLRAAGLPALATLRAQARQSDNPQLLALLECWDGAERPAPAGHNGAGNGAGGVATMRYQLRPPIVDFIGRAREAAQLVTTLRATLMQGRGAVITGLQGMGGIGKTELAYVVAHQLRNAFPDAQIVIDLRGTSAAPLTTEQALQAVIRAVAPSAQIPDDPGALLPCYRSALHGLRALILADDARDAAQVRPLLPPPGCALLITSRMRFTLPGMTTVDVKQLGDDEAATMLHGICARLSGDEAQAIARACGNLPLALRVGGGILHNDPALPITDYIRRLADERQCLAQLRDPDDEQLDVEASLGLSYALLDGPAQQVFRRLGVLAGDFATPLALGVADTCADGEETLHRLLRRNLVLYDAERARWRLHDVVRTLALRYLEAQDELAATSWRYAQAGVRITQETHAQFLAGGDAMLAALACFDAERPHIDAARRWATAHAGTPEADTLLRDDALATYHIGDLRYGQHERRSQLKCARAAAQRLGDGRSEGQILNRLGVAYGQMGDVRPAIGYLEQSLSLACELGDRRGQGAALHSLGNAYYVLGDSQRARSYFEQRLVIARELGDRRGEGGALNNLGMTYEQIGDFRQAVRYFEQALGIAHALESRNGQGIVLNNLAICYMALGDTRRALDAGEMALSIACEVGDRQQEGEALTSLGRAHAARGELARAGAAFKQALAIFREIGDRFNEARCSWHFGLALARHGMQERALPLLRTCLAYEQEVGHARAAEHAALLARLEAGEELAA